MIKLSKIIQFPIRLPLNRIDNHKIVNNLNNNNSKINNNKVVKFKFWKKIKINKIRIIIL
jgi:hypothetical protein